MPYDKYFTDRTQASLINLLSSTKRKELRNKILLIFRKLTFINETTEKVIPSFQFDSDQIKIHLKRNIITIARSLSSSTGGVGGVASGVESKAIFEALKPAIEQAWIENCAVRCGKDELDQFSAMIELIDDLVKKEVNVHNWLRVRLATPFPVQLKTSPLVRTKVNVELAQVYFKSFDLRYTKKDPNHHEFKLIKEINQFIIDMLKAEKHLTPELSRLLLSLACSLESRLSRFSMPEQSALNYTLQVHLANKELNATRRMMLNELFNQLDHKIVVEYLTKNVSYFMNKLFEQHEQAYSQLNMTLAMSLEDCLISCLRSVNHLMRTQLNFNFDFPFDKLSQVFLMDSKVQTVYVDVMYLLPRSQVEEKLTNQIDSIVQHWCNELLEAKTLIRLIYLIPVNDDFVTFAHDVLFRATKDSTNYEPVHKALSRFLCKFERSKVDDILSESITTNNETCSAVLTVMVST